MASEDFLELIYFSKCLIGNSSVGIREAAYLAVPVVNIGDRQFRRLRAKNVIDVDHDSEKICKAIQFQMSQNYKSSSIYGDGNSGEKIADILAKVKLKFHKTITY
jgi:UDP-N-acetylglucosamine 2-epimerase